LDTTRQVQEIIFRYSTTVPSPDEISVEMPLGGAGLGLDSVAILDLLFECEKRFGLEPATLLSQHQTLTVGSLLACIEKGKRD